MLRDLKVTDGKEISGNRTFVVSEIKNKVADAAKLAELLKRQG